jgi:FkbM family methyltransferase
MVIEGYVTSVKAIKGFLRKLLPAPAISFQKRMDCQDARMEGLKQQIAALRGVLCTLSENCSAQQREIRALVEEATDKYASMATALAQSEERIRQTIKGTATLREQAGATALAQSEERIRQTIREKARLYPRNWLEPRFYKDDLANGILGIPDFRIRFNRLIHNLDSESVGTVVKILRRLHLIYQTGSHSLDLFTRDEQRIVWDIKDNFLDSCFQIADSLFFYNGYLLPVDQFEPGVFYYRHGLDYLQDVSSFRDQDIIDAGAFIGDSALILSPLTNKRVYSFEPVPSNFTLMRRTLELNRVTNVVPIQKALSNKYEKLTFNLNGSCSNCCGNTVSNSSGEIVLDAITLDDFVARNKLNVGLIKTDLEGAERLFLEGALETIKQFKPALLISCYHSIDDFLDLKPMLEDLDLGYHFRIVKPIDGAVMFETMLIAEVLDD